MTRILKPSFFSLFLSLFITACTVPGSHLSGVSGETQVGLDVVIYPLTSENISNFKNIKNSPKVNPFLDSLINAYEYRIGVGDILNVIVWDHPELSLPNGFYTRASDSGSWVQRDGTIFFPYVGSVYVKGYTVHQIRKIMTDGLAKYIESPQVDVNVASFRSQNAYITGEVNKPGKQPMTNIPLTLLDAINQAEGLGQKADWKNVLLSRNGKEIKVSLLGLMQYGDLEQNHLLQAGDIVHVPQNDTQKVFVMGEVIKPQLLKMDRMGMSLTEALSSVGGINELEADATGVFIIRNERLSGIKAVSSSKKVAKIFQLNISDASALLLGTEFELKPKDIVYVTAAPISRWNRVIRQLLPSIMGVNQLTEASIRVMTWPKG